MKIFRKFFFIFFSIVDSLEVDSPGHFKLIFKKNVPFSNYSLVPNTKILMMTKTMCLNQCLSNKHCSFAIYNQESYCSLHTQFALKRLINNQFNSIYQKKYIIKLI